ncbi:hypothetical protein [Streptomyces anulatus]|uniref:hypothetical protein n=1 Tax=Streptomyces anulatus TaxID=1892 RepID=UPI000AA273D7|nr:hypothetical protein [Streptomyces anulatus]
MPSVLRSIKEREVAARQRVVSLRGELEESEAAPDRLVIAKEAVSEVLSETGEPMTPRAPSAPPLRQAAAHDHGHRPQHHRLGRVGPRESMMPAVGSGSRPAAARVFPRSRSWNA